MFTTFTEAKKYLQTRIPTENTEKFPGKMGLQRMKVLLEKINNPHHNFSSIHIVGTAGKGSTARLSAKILESAGLTVGLHTSPHLHTLRERMVVNDQLISQHDFISIVNKLKPIIEDMDKTDVGKPSYFEVLVAATFKYFAQKKVDVAVIEAGLGGKFDATNVLNSTVSVVTNVGLDHTHILGKTKAEILKDKMQVIKTNNAAAITGVQQAKLLQILQKHCKKQQVILLVLGGDFKAKQAKILNGKLKFNYTDKSDHLIPVALNTPAVYQVDNASLAIAACFEFAQAHQLPLTDNTIKTGILQTNFPGRFEIISQNPLMILDGAHNQDKMKALSSAITAAFPDKKFTVVFALKKNKNAEKILQHLQPFTKQIVITQFNKATDMGLNLSYPTAKLAKLVKENLKIAYKVEANPQQAVTLAQNWTTAESPILITGSLYLVGQLRHHLKGIP